MACPIRSAEPLFLLTGAVLRACSGFELSVRISIKIQSKFDRSSIDAPFLAWGRLPIQFGAKFDQISITLRSKFVQNCSNLDGSALRSYSVLISHQMSIKLRPNLVRNWSNFDQNVVPEHSLGRPGVPGALLGAPWGAQGRHRDRFSVDFGCPGDPNCFKLH